MHHETIRLVPGADTAVLFIHGIVGTPRHFRDAAPMEAAVPDNWSVCNILLPGHGGSVEEFAHSSMKAWKRRVWEAFAMLARDHEKVLIVGHSMGTLFAMQLADACPDKVAGLFLLACPMRPGLRFFGVVNVLRLAFGRVREDHPLEVATGTACGVETTALLWKYIPWVPRFLELFVEVGRTERLLPRLGTPCVAWQSRRDELVMRHSRKVLERAGTLAVHELAGSTHFYYCPEDQQILLREFRNFCSRVTT